MKKLGTFIAVFLLTGVAALATTTSKTGRHFYDRGYGNSFIFVEQGIEFAIFPDGQFDFNVERYGPNFGAYADFGGVSISFNSGYSYDAYVQYDDFGAVIQIENVPIFYDYYGRIVQAGNVHIRYNNFGRVARVGGLYVHYNRFNVFTHYTGFINVYNRYYVYRPWHRYYAIPVVTSCIVYNRPYRQYYTPIRHTYYRPYRDNYRPNVSYSSSRRDTRVTNTNRRSDRYIQSKDGRRDSRLADNSRNTSRRNQSGNVTSRRVETKRLDERKTINRSVDRRNEGKKQEVGVRGTRTVEKKSTPTKRVAKTTPNRKTNSVSKRSIDNNKSQRVAKSTPQRSTTSRSSGSTTKRSRGRQQ
ncbi:MAG: hypothetical protein R2785_11425 [Flavobacteriaceae bacterium]